MSILAYTEGSGADESPRKPTLAVVLSKKSACSRATPLKLYGLVTAFSNWKYRDKLPAAASRMGCRCNQPNLLQASARAELAVQVVCRQPGQMGRDNGTFLLFLVSDGEAAIARGGVTLSY